MAETDKKDGRPCANPDCKNEWTHRGFAFTLQADGWDHVYVPCSEECQLILFEQKGCKPSAVHAPRPIACGAIDLPQLLADAAKQRTAEERQRA